MDEQLLPTNPLQTLSLNTSFGDMALFFLYIVLVMYIIFTVIFFYHWRQYSSNKGVTTLTLIAYAGATLPIIATMAILVFYI